MFDRLKSILTGIHKSRGSGLNALDLDRGAPVPAEERPKAVAVENNRPTIIASEGGGVTFTVDHVVPARDVLWQSTLAESVEIRSDATIVFIPDGDVPALAPEGYVDNAIPGERRPFRTVMRRLSQAEGVPIARQLAKSQKFLHPLMQAVHLAFSHHRPLILSPDCIWLTIVQGFGHHVHENAEALRHRIVRHTGKKELLVTTNTLDPSCWPYFIRQFSSQIRENSDPVLHETLVCEFSTTTPNIKTACEIALMDTYQCYFDYPLMCVCGIPKITVQGTAEDWRRIRERIEVLATYDLEWWAVRLRPILDEFVEAAEGKPDRAFWQAIYKPQKAYAAELASGWIGDLFPYLYGAPRSASRDARGRGLYHDAAAYRNHVLSMPRVDWLLPTPPGPMAGNGVNMSNFPSGLSRAPVNLILPDSPGTEVELVGGFLGVSQRTDDHALAPILSWALVQKN